MGWTNVPPLQASAYDADGIATYIKDAAGRNISVTFPDGEPSAQGDAAFQVALGVVDPGRFTAPWDELDCVATAWCFNPASGVVENSFAQTVNLYPGQVGGDQVTLTVPVPVGGHLDRLVVEAFTLGGWTPRQVGPVRLRLPAASGGSYDAETASFYQRISSTPQYDMTGQTVGLGFTSDASSSPNRLVWYQAERWDRSVADDVLSLRWSESSYWETAVRADLSRSVFGEADYKLDHVRLRWAQSYGAMSTPQAWTDWDYWYPAGHPLGLAEGWGVTNESTSTFTPASPQPDLREFSHPARLRFL